MYITEDTAKEIINLNPCPQRNIIDQKVADRQFNVIVNGFNFLNQPENNFLYIGDEVGLGKTYIALGIASLLRLYSNNKVNYTDTILVPKENLQYKWQKEIKNFIFNNYLQRDNIVKSVLENPVGRLDNETIKNSLCIFNGQFPKYIIYRNSSFSIASENHKENNEDKNAWIEKLTNQLPEDQKDLFKKIAGKFRRNHLAIKRAFAFLLNQRIPEIDLLIVDEAHNFKHGIGYEVSVRNQVVSRIFGAVKEDEELFEFFPELIENARPKIKKLLLLSATPINNSLLEIKNQLDCFLSDHKFKKLNAGEIEKSIQNSLNEFMIRGAMNIIVNSKPYSRNGYRHEHRKGNVEMAESAGFQLIKNNTVALVLCMIQYKTIKELKLNCNNQFEMGLLAGFESFYNTKSNYEENTLENRRENEAKDETVLKDLIDSYYQKFNCYPPHPKQESLIEELFSLLINRKKALVFVRRIASVRELERKLFKKYSDYLIEKIKTVTKGTNIDSINILLRNYQEDKYREGIEIVIDRLTDRITPELKSDDDSGESDKTMDISSSLREINNSLIENEEINRFKEQIKKHIGLKIIKTELKECAIDLLKRKWDNKLGLGDDDDEDDENSLTEPVHDEEGAPYFFQKFFYNEGKKFKKRSYKKDWYELNLLLLNDKFNLFKINPDILSREYEFFNENFDDNRKFQRISECIVQAIKSQETIHSQVRDVFRTNTFFTSLLCDFCYEEFSGWIEKHKIQICGNYYSRFLESLDTLIEVLRSVFRQGSGILPAFIAESKASKKDDPHEGFINEMKYLLTGEFDFVLNEVKQIILDYDKIVERNFDDINKIKYNLIQQLPVAGISGQHKKDVRKTAIQFRMPGYPYILITTDILKEGEDLHTYCKNIYHYGIAWNPSDMEQRTGRIDRIDSMTYRSLKEIEGTETQGIPFSNKLQVFYPYLADTLEVNQMIRLFNGMDKFIEIFYNDLSAKIEKNSKASVDDIILDIPPQRHGLLKSRYEYDSFKFIPNGEKLRIREMEGTGFNELFARMENILEELNQFNYKIKPDFDKSRLVISGVMDLEGRNGPFKIYYRQKLIPGSFEYFMESTLGKAQLFGKSSNRLKTQEIISLKNKEEDLNFELRESNSYVFVTIKKDFSSEINEILITLHKLITITDFIEDKVLQSDENIE